jgi:outer membrane protein
MPPRKYIIFSFLILLAAGVKAQQAARSYTLQQCLAIAIKNNLQVQQSGLAAATDSLAFLQSKENLLPSISGSASRELSQGRGINPVTNAYVNQGLTSDNYSLAGSVNIFNGLSYQNAIKQAKLAYQAGKMDFQAAKDVITIQIITNYLLVLDNEEILEASKSQLAVAQENVNHDQILEDNGATKTASELYDFKGELAGSQVALVTAENSLNSAKLSLFQLMNVPYDKGAGLEPLNAEDLTDQHDVDPEQVYETALQQLALVKAAALHRESAEKAVKVARGELYPTLALYGGISTNYSSAGQRSVFVDSTSSAVPGLYLNTPTGKQSVYNTSANYANQDISYGSQIKNNYGTYVQLGLNIPIFTNYIKRNAIAQAKINLLNEQYVEDNTKIQLRQNVEQAYYNMAAAYNRYQALNDQVKAYAESFRISKIRFDAGVLTSVDYIIAKNNIDAANLNMISARYDYFIYSKILDYYQGKLSF